MVSLPGVCLAACLFAIVAGFGPMSADQAELHALLEEMQASVDMPEASLRSVMGKVLASVSELVRDEVDSLEVGPVRTLHCSCAREKGCADAEQIGVTWDSAFSVCMRERERERKRPGVNLTGGADAEPRSKERKGEGERVCVCYCYTVIVN